MTVNKILGKVKTFPNIGKLPKGGNAAPLTHSTQTVRCANDCEFCLNFNQQNLAALLCLTPLCCA
jgi:hypothetical protein